MSVLESSLRSIDFARPGEMSRKVVKRSNARATYKYPSWKMRSTLQCESINERNFMLYLDVCPEVLNFRPQPCAIRYVMHGADHIHYPDVYIETICGQYLVELKTLNGFDLHIRNRTDLLSILLPNHGYQYHLLIADYFNNPIFLENAWRIKRGGMGPLPLLAREQLRQLFKHQKSIAWRLLQNTLENPYLNQYVCHLILEGKLDINFMKPIEAETEVCWFAESQSEGVRSWASLISKKVQ